MNSNHVKVQAKLNFYEIIIKSADGPDVILACADRTQANVIATEIINDVVDVSIRD